MISSNEEKEKEYIIEDINDLFEEFRIHKFSYVDPCVGQRVGDWIKIVTRGKIDAEYLIEYLEALDYKNYPNLIKDKSVHDLLADFIDASEYKGYVVIDRKMSDIVTKLNNYNLATTFCCQGHFDIIGDNEDDYMLTEPYIEFKTNNIDDIIYALKMNNIDMSVEFQCINQYTGLYNIRLSPSSKVYNDFLEDNDDKYNEGIIKVFDHWFKDSLKPFVDFICD